MPVSRFEQGASGLLHSPARDKALERRLESVAFLLRRFPGALRVARLCLKPFKIIKSADIGLFFRSIGVHSRPRIRAYHFIRIGTPPP